MERIRKKRRRMIRLLTLAALVVAVFAAVFLFRVKTVVVSGNTRHTGQEIASDLSYDFLTQNSLYLMWKCRGGRVPESMPYLSSLELTLESPSKISVTVVEKDLAGYLDKDQNIYFDKDGIVLEISDEIYDDVPVVTGVSIGEAVLYQKLPTDSSAQLRTILSIVKLLKYQDLTAKEIRFSDNMDITLTVDNVEAELGQDEYLEEKIANLRAILDSLVQKAGTLHMENFTGKNEPVTFAEGGELVTEAESETSPEGEDGSADTAGEGTGEDTGDTDGTLTGTDALLGEDTDSPEGMPAGDTAEGGDSGTVDSTPSTTFMVFNSSGQLVYDAQVVNGVVVNSSGTPIDGCTVNEDGNVVDAYWNVIDPATGQLAQ
ncbi:MAG: cell division protein FtsQ/DivIB [Lachnospiraceae bacterium]|nr:cell division protein FtsQ/DivIB [Lachnospiraceae bacterium]